MKCSINSIVNQKCGIHISYSPVSGSFYVRIIDVPFPLFIYGICLNFSVVPVADCPLFSFPLVMSPSNKHIYALVLNPLNRPTYNIQIFGKKWYFSPNIPKYFTPQRASGIPSIRYQNQEIRFCGDCDNMPKYNSREKTRSLLVQNTTGPLE